jgi:alpha-tubulin suppressor-like RCC1 family protein
VGGDLSFVDLVVGLAHACGRLANGAAYCWGDNDFGQLGDGTTVLRQVAVAVKGNLSFVELSAGAFHTCGRVASGAVFCWGGNVDGQLGDGSTTNRMIPSAVVGDLSFVEIDAGGAYPSTAFGSHTCGRLLTGATYCWGHNAFGQLGDGTTIGKRTPTFVPLPVKQVP